MSNLRNCRRCSKDLPIESFGRRGYKKYQSWCKDCASEYQKERRKASPWTSAKKRRYAKARNYKITEEEVRELEKRKRCDCCKKLFRKLANQRIDHCHETGEIRGVICNNCNVGIGMLGDNLEGLEAAVRYLRKNL